MVNGSACICSIYVHSIIFVLANAAVSSVVQYINYFIICISVQLLRRDSSGSATHLPPIALHRTPAGGHVTKPKQPVTTTSTNPTMASVGGPHLKKKGMGSKKYGGMSLYNYRQSQRTQTMVSSMM